MASASPLTLPANWVFRVTEGTSVAPYHRGSRRAALAACLVALAALVPLHVSLWTWDIVVFHLVLGVLYAACVVEFLFNTQTRVPFTAPYISGSIRLKTRWWGYLVGAWLLTGIPSFLEARALVFGRGGVVLPVTVVLLTAALATLRCRKERDAQGLKFDEIPDDAYQTLGLRE